MRPDPLPPSDETLLGYLLGALSDEESLAIEGQLANSDALMQRLSDLRSMLEPFADELLEEGNSSDTQPSNDLIDGAGQEGFREGFIEETMAMIAKLDPSKSSDRDTTHTPNAQSNESTNKLSNTVSALGDHSQIGTSEPASAPFGIQLAWLDSLVALAVGIVFLSFLLPGLLQWREVARQQECAENLRHIGDALRTFAQFQPAHRLPAIEPNSPLSFAGVYAIRLRDLELLETERWLQCPSEPAPNWMANVPTSLDYLIAGREQQQVWRFLAGGDYAYHMGTLIGGKYAPPNSQSSRRIAWIGDRLPVPAGSKESLDSDFEMHGRRAVNILFSDGSVQWLRLPKLSELMTLDNPYLNDDREQAPGLSDSDACLGPSHLFPAAKVSAIRTIDKVAPQESAMRRGDR
jgi:prepilin-type processing-associated H-X9-DG protein